MSNVQRLLVRSTCALALAAACTLPALAQGSKAKGKAQLIPARFQTHTDGLGQPWNLDSRGNLQVSRVGQVHELRVNGMNFNSTQRLMTKDGREYVFQGKCGNFTVERRARIHQKLAGVRMVDIVSNPGNQPLSVSLTLTARINMMPSALLSNTGAPLTTNLGKKDTGLVVNTSNQVTIFMGLVGRGTKIKPSFAKRHNYELVITYQLKIPAKSQAAIITPVASMQGNPTPKQRDAIFKDFRKPKYVRDLPRGIRRRVVNQRMGVMPGNVATLASLEEELGITGATLDLLAFGSDTRVRGTAHCKKLEIESNYGRATISFEKIAAMAGKAYKGGDSRLHFKDGQKLSGKLLAEELRFEMTTGLAVELNVERLDRLVIRKAQESPMAPPGRLLVETQSGDRLMVKSPPGTKIGLATRWGVRKVPLERVKSLGRIGEGQPGFWVTLTDKSRFRAFFSDDVLELESELFGRVRFAPSEVRAMVSADAIRKNKDEADDDDDGEILQPFLRLVGGDLIVGQIDLAEVKFAGTGEVLPAPPTQIRTLTNILEGEAPEFGEGVGFRANLWGGGEIMGVLRQALLPVQTGDGRIWIPTRELMSAHVPTPQIPPALRQRISVLIRELANPSWQKRERASRELKSLGALTRMPLEEAKAQTKDPEVERRVRELLASIEDED